MAPSEREEMLAAGVEAPIHLVPNGIQLDQLPPPDARSQARVELGVEGGVPVVGMIGRLHFQKDPLTFVRL